MPTWPVPLRSGRVLSEQAKYDEAEKYCAKRSPSAARCTARQTSASPAIWNCSRHCFGEQEAGPRRRASLPRRRGHWVETGGRLADAARYRWSLAVSRDTLGNLLNEAGRRADAEACYRDALALWEKLVAESPRNSDYRSHLGHTLWYLGDVLFAFNAIRRRNRSIVVARNLQVTGG